MTKKKIVFTSGTFDLFHSGHLNILKKAKRLGSYLIVGVSTNKLVKTHKKINPIMNYRQRREVVRSVKYVDKVVKQSKLIDVEQIKRLKVDLYVIGDDWKNRNDIDGLNWLKKRNKVVFIPYTKSLSSTRIKNKIIKNAYEIIKAQK